MPCPAGEPPLQRDLCPVPGWALLVPPHMGTEMATGISAKPRPPWGSLHIRDHHGDPCKAMTRHGSGLLARHGSEGGHHSAAPAGFALPRGSSQAAASPWDHAGRGAGAAGSEKPLWTQSNPSRAGLGRWSIPGAQANPGTSRLLLQQSSTFPFLSLASDLAAKAVFHSCVNIWKKRGGEIVISVKPWECGCPENKQKLCFFSERPL